MAGEFPVVLVLDLVGTFAFALNGALTAVRAVHVDVVGVVTLGMVTAVGGGIFRDVLLGALPPATFVDWRYLGVAAKALALRVGPAQAIILGTVTAVGGGTLRDVLTRQVPGVLSRGLYAIPALVGAASAVIPASGGVDHLLGAPVALSAAGLCFLIRMVGLHFGLDAPTPPGAGGASVGTGAGLEPQGLRESTVVRSGREAGGGCEGQG